MSVRWAGAGRRRQRLRPHRWPLAMGPRLLLLVLLCKGWPWAWASEAPMPATLPPPPSARGVNGSPVAVIGRDTVTVASTVPQSSNHSGGPGGPAPSLNQTLQCLLFVLSGSCALTAFYFLGRAFIFEVQLNKKNYGRLPREEPLETASTDSDEDTVFETRLYK
ncbi:protein FAM174C-like [Trichosurus vulpecula]|uniref:protein FAM174C-like n=1 Tax=Trichosurus vulpecula TaxID=9337 RepID=UPI00186AF47B|nr:protein FAM174C-like [Trichosurus vulpecula]